MTVDFTSLRDQFSVLDERTYLAVQCFGPCPKEAFDDLNAYGRSLLLRSRCLDEWVGRYEEMHGHVEALFEAPAGTVVLRDTATAIQGTIASCLSPEGARKRIVISSADFHSARYLWRAQERRGFEVVEVDVNGSEHADAATYLEAIDERTAIVALSYVSPRSGALLDASAIAARAREVGAVFVLDAYQAVGIVPTRVRELGAHVVVGGGHKWVGAGGTGLAFAYVEPALSERLEPPYPGWLGGKDLLKYPERMGFLDGARRFSQGTPAMEPIFTARAGLKFVRETGIDALRARSAVLTGRIAARAVEHGIRLHTPSRPEQRGGMICLDIPYPEAKRIVEVLGARGIDVDARPGAGIRVGPHPCITVDECDRTVDAIAAELC